MLSRLWKWLKRTLFVFTVIAITLTTLVAYLAFTSPEPRASESWQRLPNLPHPRGEMASAVGAWLVEDETTPGDPGESSLDQLFVIGGLGGLGGTTDLVDIYDPGTGEWRDGPRLPAARHHAAAASIGGVVFVSGGATTATDWTPRSNFWQLLPISDTWEELAPMPDARMGHQMVAIGRKLYVIGGRGETSNVMIFDTETGSWSTGAEMEEPRDHLVAAASGVRIYAIGGRHSELTDRVDVYDTARDRWIPGPPLPEPMSGMIGGKLTDGIHVVGGEDPATFGGGVIDKHYVSDGVNEWREAPLPILPTHGSGGVVMRGSLVKVGGARRQGAFSPVAWTGLLEVYTLGAGSPDPGPS